MVLNLLSLLALPFPPPQYVLGGYPSQWTLFFRQCSHVGFASSHFFFRLLQVMQPVLLRPLGGFESGVVGVLGCFRGRPRGLRETDAFADVSWSAGTSSVIIPSSFSSMAGSSSTSSTFGVTCESVGLDESVSWRTFRLNAVAVLGDSLDGLGLVGVNGDEHVLERRRTDGDEHVLERRRTDGASGPNTTGAAICVYVSLKIRSATQDASSNGHAKNPCQALARLLPWKLFDFSCFAEVIDGLDGQLAPSVTKPGGGEEIASSGVRRSLWTSSTQPYGVGD